MNVQRKIILMLLYIFADSLESQCKDMSDAVYPAENETCEKKFMKYCKNNQTCIHENLFCDGHEQCEDGSDEDQEFCKHCPR
jgi:hypothetical protein